MGPWTEADFEKLSWHDVHVHGLRIVEGEHGAGDLLLDIDYILEWQKQEKSFSFRIAPATLSFHQITDLKLSLDFATPTAGIVPFSLFGITREPITYPTGYKSFSWELEIVWPEGSFTFKAPRFTQTLTGPAARGGPFRLNRFPWFDRWNFCSGLRGHG